MNESLCCLMADFFLTKCKLQVMRVFSVSFFYQLERQATIFDKQNQNLRMKRAFNHCPTPTLGKLDNNLSPRVGDFAQKNHPRPNLPGGDPRGYT